MLRDIQHSLSPIGQRSVYVLAHSYFFEALPYAAFAVPMLSEVSCSEWPAASGIQKHIASFRPTI